MKNLVLAATMAAALLGAASAQAGAVYDVSTTLNTWSFYSHFGVPASSGTLTGSFDVNASNVVDSFSFTFSDPSSSTASFTFASTDSGAVVTETLQSNGWTTLNFNNGVGGAYGSSVPQDTVAFDFSPGTATPDAAGDTVSLATSSLSASAALPSYTFGGLTYMNNSVVNLTGTVSSGGGSSGGGSGGGSSGGGSSGGSGGSSFSPDGGGSSVPEPALAGLLGLGMLGLAARKRKTA